MGGAAGSPEHGSQRPAAPEGKAQLINDGLANAGPVRWAGGFAKRRMLRKKLNAPRRVRGARACDRVRKNGNGHSKNTGG